MRHWDRVTRQGGGAVVKKSTDVKKGHLTRGDNRSFGYGGVGNGFHIGFVGIPRDSGLQSPAVEFGGDIFGLRSERQSNRGWTGNVFFPGREIGFQSHAQIANQIGIAPPILSRQGGASSSDSGSVQATTTTSTTEFEALFLCAAVAYKRSQDQCVGNGGGGEDFERCQEGAELLIAVPVDDRDDAIDGDPD